jgi:hypothetical protein
MRRRAFITLLCGATAWPLAARAQQRERMRRIGVLMSARPDDPYQTTYLSAFMQGLQERGWTIGRNVRLDYRWGAGNSEFSFGSMQRN